MRGEAISAPKEVAIAQNEGDLVTRLDSYHPLVARGLASEWPLARELDYSSTGEQLAAAAKLFNNAEVRYSQLPPGQQGELGIGDDLQPNFSLDEYQAGADDFLELVARMAEDLSDACVYAPSLPIDNFPAFRDRLPTRTALAGRPLWNQLLWVGSGKHTVGLHYDEMLNLITQFAGRKRVTLLPPSTLTNMYPAPLHRTVGGVPRSMVKLLAPDLQRYPRFTEAMKEAQQVLLEPGDVLYVPPLWWHHVESFGFNVMVNAWYSDRRSDHPDAYSKANTLLRKAMSRRAGTYSAREAERDWQEFQVAIEHLTPYWGDWLNRQFRYYVAQESGDPYPTLPGALRDFAKHERKRRLRQNRLLRWPLTLGRRLRDRLRAFR